MSNRSRPVVQFLLFLILCCCLLITPGASANSLEEKVLQIIDQHPESILKSLVNYQRQQQEQQQQTKDRQLRQQLPQILAQSPVIGDPFHAKKILIEFADFQCPFCKDVGRELKQLHEQFPATAFVFKHLPLPELHPQAMNAAITAWAADRQGRFWEYHDALFRHQDQLQESTYRAIAQRLELDLNQFGNDRHSDAAIQSIDRDINLAQSLRIRATPFFVLVSNDRINQISGFDLTTIIADLNQEQSAWEMQNGDGNVAQ